MKQDKELLVSIQKAMDSSPFLRSKKALIEQFIENVDYSSDIRSAWNRFVKENMDQELANVIFEENLNEERTKQFMEDAFIIGELKTSGKPIDQLMPNVSWFGSARPQKRLL